jgi:hypothetical protein
LKGPTDHWGQLQTYVKAACDKCMWSVLATRLTRQPLAFKGRLRGMLYASGWGNKACNKAILCLSKAALQSLFQVQTTCICRMWPLHALLVAPSVIYLSEVRALDSFWIALFCGRCMRAFTIPVFTRLLETGVITRQVFGLKEMSGETEDRNTCRSWLPSFV